MPQGVCLALKVLESHSLSYDSKYVFTVNCETAPHTDTIGVYMNIGKHDNMDSVIL